jgi:pyruvate kinase
LRRLDNKTKIIATIGPASRSEEILRELIKNGIDLVRLNFSFGTYQEHAEVIERVRKLSEELHMPVAIVQDLQGPKLRVQKILGGSVDLNANASVSIVETLDVDKNMISISYPNLSQYVSKDMHLLLDDGLIELKIDGIEPGKIHCKVLHGGHLIEGKGLNIPSSGLKIPAITEKDKEDLDFGLKNNVDFVALSFVRPKNDLLELKNLMKKSKKEAEIIAKIEKPEAIDNITDILQVASAIMVARGDLAIEMPLERVPSLQKKLVDLCHIYQKPVIIATQMLYTMEMNPRPSRAEVSDVANAIRDGCDVVMLSGETAIGKYPVETVQILEKIIAEAEKVPFKVKYKEDLKIETIYQIPSNVGHAAVSLADELHAKAIFTFTASGFTALAISKQRPKTPIIALTTKKEIQRRCCMYWGVRSFITDFIRTTDEMFQVSEKVTLSENIAKKGDIVIITAGIPFGTISTTNMIKVHTIGE